MKEKVSAGVMPLVMAFAHSTTMLAGGGSSSTVLVTNSNDDGPGSFRRAIAAASADSKVARIQFLGIVSTIRLRRTVEFTGTQDLTIIGNGAALDGARAAGPALLATGGASLTVSGLDVRNPYRQVHRGRDQRRRRHRD